MHVAITPGPYTTNSALLHYQVNGQDWQLTDVTTNATHLLVGPNTVGVNVTTLTKPWTSELRVTKWAYGVQIASVSVVKDHKIFHIPDFDRRIEIIGDSLSAAQYATLGGLASYAYGLGAGLGNTEYTITAYPGIYVFDKQFYGNLRAMILCLRRHWSSS